jgi:hypothetical protein
MKFYIVHYTILTERKIHIINQLQNAGINDYEFIETFDKEDIQLHPLFSKFSSNSINNDEEIINKPIDHWFNYIRKKYNLIYYLSEPTLVSQGSEKCLFSSSVRDRL